MARKEYKVIHARKVRSTNEYCYEFAKVNRTDSSTEPNTNLIIIESSTIQVFEMNLGQPKKYKRGQMVSYDQIMNAK